jgi:hypothetical protein
MKHRACGGTASYVPYKSMVIELLATPGLATPGLGALRFGLEFVSERLPPPTTSAPLKSFKPWCFVCAPSLLELYPPAWNEALRDSMSQGRIFWIRTPEALVPECAQLVLESGLCSGVFIWGLEKFSKSAPAALWGRRWQLAAHRTGTHLIWIHQKSQALIGFDLRLEWKGQGFCEVRKGFGKINDEKIQKLIRGTHGSAA